MKKDRGIWVQIIIILSIGLVVSGIADRELLDSLQILWINSDLETLLETISLILAFVSLTLIVVFLVIRAAREGTDKRLEDGEEEG